MPLDAARIGAELTASRASVTVRQALAYAAGIGALDPRLFDDARDGGIVAPPPFVVRLEWPVVSNLKDSHPLGASPDERIRSVHAGQDSRFHRPIRPGDDLTTRGRIVGLRATRAGTLVTSKLETVESATGAPVVTSWSTGIYRDVALIGEAPELERAPAWPLGATGPANWREETIAVPRAAPHVYSECADIWNPIHTERGVALKAGLPDIILHGTATWALAARAVIDAFADGDPTRLARFAGRFAAMVIPGDPIAVRMGRDDAGIVHYRVLNAAGEPAIRDGMAQIAG